MNTTLDELLKQWAEQAPDNSPEKILLQILQERTALQTEESQKSEEEISPFIYPH